MGAKKYVPQGTFLACDKGTVPMEFKITNNNNAFLFEEPIANTGDMVPMVNVQPFGVCSITTNACVPAPIAWDGFEDGIFVGYFNPLLEDSVLPCGVGGKIEIFYSLEDATAACAPKEGSFWSTLAKVVLVVAAVALIVVTGGMAIAAIGAIAAASGALATGIAVTVAALEVAGCLLTVKALYDYSQDGDEEALFKEVALGFLFLGLGKAIEKGFRMWKAAKAGDEVVEGFEHAYHVKNNQYAQSVLDNIDPAYFNNGNRFADGFYVAQKGETAIAEVVHHGGDMAESSVIRFAMDDSNLKILDLTDPDVAKAWKYDEALKYEQKVLDGTLDGNVYDKTIELSNQAREQGYNAIKFGSQRADGVNMVVYETAQAPISNILSPEMIVPATN